jgi:nucleotide-binding universal stress UspA family protein
MFFGSVSVLIRNVLVAVDGSENSGRALDFALDFAEKYGAAVMILNVSEPPVMGVVPQEPTAYASEGVAVFAKDLSRFHKKILSKAVAHARAIKPNVPVASKLREGDPALEIVAEAKERAFDVIVVGHVGAGRVKELFGLGGISEKVAHLSPCLVVIVR